MKIQVVPDLETIRYQKEIFPGKKSEFNRLFDLHGREVRGKPFQLDFKRYHQIEFERRLVWIVARSIETNAPIGYACSSWCRDLNFDERVAYDGLWFVQKEFRDAGVGKTVKVMCHTELAKQGVVRIYDSIRMTYRHGTLMRDLGFEPGRIVWVKDL
jgi:hypothetical protein